MSKSQHLVSVHYSRHFGFVSPFFLDFMLAPHARFHHVQTCLGHGAAGLRECRHVRDWGAFWEITHSRRVRSGVHPLERQHTITHYGEGKTWESSLCSLQLSGELTSPGGRERSEFGGTPRGGIHMKTSLSFWDRLPGFGLMIDSAGALGFMGELFIAIREGEMTPGQGELALANLFCCGQVCLSAPELS